MAERVRILRSPTSILVTNATRFQAADYRRHRALVQGSFGEPNIHVVWDTSSAIVHGLIDSSAWRDRDIVKVRDVREMKVLVCILLPQLGLTRSSVRAIRSLSCGSAKPRSLGLHYFHPCSMIILDVRCP